jgi:hypothetical protein
VDAVPCNLLNRLTALWTTDRVHARQPRLFLMHLKPDCHRPVSGASFKEGGHGLGRRGLFNRGHGSA